MNETTNNTTEPIATPDKLFLPRVDIVETEDSIRLTADLPGVSDEDLDIVLEKNLLTLKGKVKRTIPEGYAPAYREYEEGDYERTFTIPDEIDRPLIEASIDQGTLHLTLPKAKHVLSKKIPVKTR